MPYCQLYPAFKRLCDLLFSLLLIIIFFPLVLLLIVVSSLVTGKSGLFCQTRVGINGRPFTIYKIRSISGSASRSTQTVIGIDRISPFGLFIRKFKLDELPQLINIFIGQMSFVGPRPDVPSVLDSMSAEQAAFLSVKPGLSSLASLAYIDEESLVSNAVSPEQFYIEKVLPDKIYLNLYYSLNFSFLLDLLILVLTILAFFGLRSFCLLLRSRPSDLLV